jgi:hypothetical protein
MDSLIENVENKIAFNQGKNIQMTQSNIIDFIVTLITRPNQ